MRLVPGPEQPQRRDFSLIGGCTAMKVPLAYSVQSVRVGTPIKPTPDGWVHVAVDKPWETVAFAGEYRPGGEVVLAYLALSAELPRPSTDVPGTRFGVGDVDDFGQVTLVPQATGPHILLSRSTILMQRDTWEPPHEPAPSEPSEELSNG